jgi:hypothetical protein
MVRFYLKSLSSFILLFLCGNASGQSAEFNGQVAGWITGNYSNGYAVQTGVRYLPQLIFNIPAGKKYRFEGELTADGYLNYSHLPDTGNIFGSDLSLYRAWIRFSGDRFEVRAGLQKINFGSASMLRPLMWFDRIDPRDPLKLTRGVYGILGKYYLKNNSNIWLWILYGNKDPRGWETIPSGKRRPEIGGRIQFQVPRGELAFSYHNREGEFPENWQPPVTGSRYFPENRLGFDLKLDLGVGLWLEGSTTHSRHPDIDPYSTSCTIGADYNIPVGNGLNITAEHLLVNNSDMLLSGGRSLNFTGISLTSPLSVITRLSTIVFYDWKNNGWYRFANLSFTFDKIAVNIICFWNPDAFNLFNYEKGPNMFAGGGGQLMLVYNY